MPFFCVYFARLGLSALQLLQLPHVSLQRKLPYLGFAGSEIRLLHLVGCWASEKRLSGMQRFSVDSNCLRLRVMQRSPQILPSSRLPNREQIFLDACKGAHLELGSMRKGKTIASPQRCKWLLIQGPRPLLRGLTQLLPPHKVETFEQEFLSNVPNITMMNGGISRLYVYMLCARMCM